MIAALAGCGATAPAPVAASAATWTLGDSARDAGPLRLSLGRTEAGALVAVIGLSDSTRDTLPRLVARVRAIVPQLRAQPTVAAIAVAIPAADTAGLPAAAFLPLVDYVILELYDEHSPFTGPGPIASAQWVRRVLAARVAEIGASRLVAALPAYGYLWRVNGAAQAMSLDEARHAAAEANVELVRDPSSGALHGTRPGRWDLWLSDAEQVRALRSEAIALGVTRIALYSHDH